MDTCPGYTPGMFDNAPSVFENVASDHRPDVASTASPMQSAAGMSGSPDGLGAFARPTRGTGEYFAPAQGTGAYAQPVDGMGGQIEWLEPTDASPSAAMRSAGLTALAAAVFFGSGLALGGPWGGVSGIMLSGAGFNMYRAQKWWGSADASEKHEAVVSALFAAIGVAAGGYTAYKAYETKK